MPFDTENWLNHPGLKSLSPEIRGLWVDMLCYMWESAERGVMVKPNLEIYTREEIKRLIGVDSTGSDAWLDRLVMLGVCAVRSDGAFYSRQMVRDEEIRAKRREAGKKGGDVTKAKVFTTPVITAPPQTDPIRPEQVEDPQEKPTPESPPPLTQEQKAKAEKAKKYKYAEFVTLTRDEYAKLCELHGEEAAKRMIEILDNYKGSKGKKYKSDYRTILNWVVDRYNEEIQKYGSSYKNGRTAGETQSSDTPKYTDTL